MNALVRVVLAKSAVAISLLAILMAIIPSNPTAVQGAGSPPTANVAVVNTPLPVTLQGTGTVAGTVDAKQSGDWKVSILGTPNVNVTNAPHVIVDNTGQPFQANTVINICDGCLAQGETAVYTVPEDKRAVIEYVTVAADSLDATDSMVDFVSTTVGTTLSWHYLGVAGPQGRVKIDSASNNTQISSKSVRLYADPGTDVGVGVTRLTRAPKVTVYVTISGYLMDVP